MEKINILSLFDGMSCGQIALDRLGMPVGRYYASEIDKYAIAVTQHNYPETVQLGDVTKWRERDIDRASIDLIQGGSPCQGFSLAGKQLNFEDPRSRLFFVFVDILNHIKQHNPQVKFLLENVRMKKEYQDIITDHIGVDPIKINSALVSAQNRIRLYWTNIEGVEQPKDKGILLKDVLDNDADPSMAVGVVMRGRYENGKVQQKIEVNGKEKSNAITTVQKDSLVGYKKPIRVGHLNSGGQGDRIYSIEGKSVCLSTHGGGIGVKTGLYKIGNTNPSGRGQNGNVYGTTGKSPTLTTNKGEGPKIIQKGRGYNKGGEHHEKSPSLTKNARQENNKLDDGYTIRKLTPKECERLQTVPDDYTLAPHPVYKGKDMSNAQRYKMLGNGWTVDVIAHIYSSI